MTRVAGSISIFGRGDRLGSQFLRFVLVGVLSTIIDGFAYRLLLPGATVEVAKAAGYLAGMTCSILCNYRWTFAYTGPNRGSIVLRCIVLYLSALVVNVTANRGALAILPPGSFLTLAAFLFAVGTTTIYNFIGMRLIFRHAAVSPQAGQPPSRQEERL